MIDLQQLKKEMKKTINHLEDEFSHLQIGRASTGLVEAIDIFVPHY
jgi:ribosome recycling factor